MLPTFKIRTLMLLVAVCSLAALMTRQWLNAPAAYTVGNGALRIKVRVLDASTGNPLENAWIRQKDLDFPEAGPGVELRTDELGEAIIVEMRLIYGVVDNQKRLTQRVACPLWGLQVGKDGYNTTAIPVVRDRIGTGGDPTNGGLEPPAIVVRIEKSDL